MNSLQRNPLILVCGALSILSVFGPALARADGPTEKKDGIDVSEAGGREFTGDLSGLRDYLEDIKDTYPSLYAALDPDVSRLESREHWALGASIAGVVVGAAVTVGSLTFWGDNRESKYIKAKRANLPLLGVGLGVIALSTLPVLLLTPDRADVREIIEKHNKLLPKEPLELDVGLLPPVNDRAGAFVSVRLPL